MPQPKPPAADSQLLGQRYETIATIGSGGMGTVFRARDTHSGAVVAIKQLRRDAVARDPSLLERFAREHEVLARLNHPNIVRVLDAFATADDHYLVMEFMSGGSLDALLVKESEPLAMARVLGIAIDLTDALTRVHRLDIVHRDIKPSNVLLASDGTPRLSDFGLAQLGASGSLTEPSAVVGTLDYLCPEALQGRRLDARADLWGLGALLFEMLTQRRPFSAEHVGAVLHAIANQPPPDLEALCPACPSELVDLVYRLLEKDPAQRIPSARQVGLELERILRGSRAEFEIGVPRASGENYRASEASEPSDAFATQDSVWHGLIVELTPFVGRSAELLEVTRLLSNPETRLITIRGPGGMGKSRLAREVGRQLAFGASDARQRKAKAERTAPRVELCELAPLNSADLMVAAIADTVGLVFSSGASQKEQLLRCLARMQRLLLILDNFEHLLSGASLLSEIHAAAPGVQMLVTSRESLGLSYENIFDLQGMSGTQLFFACARRVKPNFELTRESSVGVARICDLVSGMPLGITLAAAWVNLLEPSEIADEITRSFEFLEAEFKDLPERHQSVRAVFEHSWKLLTLEERRVFAALSVFRAGFTRLAAHSIAGATLRTLGALLNKSLISRDPVSGRYAIHELLRQYAAEQLRGNPEAEAQIFEQHCAYYTALLAGLYPRLLGASSAAACDEIDRELDNVRLAWTRAVEGVRLSQLAAAIEALSLFFLLKGYLAEAAAVFGGAARLLTGLQPARASELARLAGLAFRHEAQAQHEQWLEAEAEVAAERALALLDERVHPREAAAAQFTLAIARYWLAGSGGSTLVPLSAAELALNLYRSTDDWWGTARALCAFGELTDPIRGEACFRECIALQSSNGEGKIVLPGGLIGLAIIREEQGARAHARSLLLEALGVSELRNDISAQRLALERLAVLELRAGNLEAAEAYAQTRLARCKESAPFAERNCQITLGDVRLAKGLLDAAEQCFSRGLDGSESWIDARCDAMTAALAERGLGDVDARRGRHSSARRRLMISLTFFERMQVPWGIVFAADSLAWAACLAGDTAVAQDQFHRVLQLAAEWRWWPWVLSALAGHAWGLQRSGQAERAVQLAALVAAHPATEYVIRVERAEPLLASLAESLPSAAFERAAQRGRKLGLAAAVRWLDGAYGREHPREQLSAQGLRNLRTLLRNPGWS